MPQKSTHYLSLLLSNPHQLYHYLSSIDCLSGVQFI